MKKILITILIFFTTTITFANDSFLIKENSINSKINEIGTKILNANKIEKRIIFAYDKDEKIGVLKNTKALTSRQVIVYAEAYKNISDDNELAAYIAREIPAALRSYDGIASGWLSSVKIKAAPKKYELVFDKFAIDYMVKAGYNPIGLITYINKTCPQKRQDRFSSNNLTSKRLAYIYEYIYMKHPEFLANNVYIENEYYQNFLLTSQENRKLFQEKVEKKDWKAKLDYK